MPSESQARPPSNARSPSLRLLARISQYELLNRMWTDKNALGAVVRARDFAYPATNLMVADDSDICSISDIKSIDFASLLSGPIVEIIVGKDKRHWSIHRNLLARQASRLAASIMSNDPKKTSPQQTIELLQDDPAGFELFVKWLYQGRLDDANGLSDEQKYEHAVACHKLYLLCNRFDMPELKNLSMDHYRLSLHQAGLVPDPSEINEIYKASPEHSAFRKLMTQIAARQMMDPDDERDAEDYRQCFEDNPDFAIDMVNAIRRGTQGFLFDDPTGTGEACEYHDHSHGAGCSHRPRDRSKSKSSNDSNDAAHPRVTISEMPDHNTTSTSPKRARVLNEEDLIHLLKALPTTSTEIIRDDSQWQTITDEVDQTPQAPPPTPAKPTRQVKAQQDRLNLVSAVGSMDTILEADRKMEERRSKATVPRGENPLNYVAALRLRQGQQNGHSRRRSRDLFDV